LIGRNGKTPRLWAIVDVALLTAAVVTLGLLCRPGGPIGRKWVQWRASREKAAVVRDHWDSLVSGSTFFGNRESEAAVVVFLDYECPYCRQAHTVIKEFLDDHPEARVVVRHLPLSQIHSMAEGAALFALCSGEQGRFTAVHDYLMEESAWRERGDWMSVGEALGMTDDPRFQSCLAQEGSRALLDEDIVLARALRLTGTPAFVTRSGVHEGGPVTPALLARLAGFKR